VQAKEDTSAVHAAAQRGTAGGGGSLPYQSQIQKSFGAHDVSGISAHVGGKAEEACDSMGAQAYASGSSVAFKGQPDLHTAAHEAAHIVQQRSGVQLSGGVGKAGDGYEKHADEVANRVVQGKSAEDLLGGAARGGAASVQRLSQREAEAGGSGVVSGISVQRAQTRNVQRSAGVQMAPAGQKAATEKTVGLDTSKISQGSIGASFAAGIPLKINGLPQIRTPLPGVPGGFSALGVDCIVQAQGGGNLSIKEGAKLEIQASANCKGFLQIGLGVPDANVNIEGAIDVAVASVTASVSKHNGKYSGSFSLSRMKVEAQLSLNAKAGPLGASWALAKAPIGEFMVMGYDSKTGKWAPSGWTWSEEAKDFFARFSRMRGQGYSKTALDKEVDKAMKDPSPDYKSLILSIASNKISATSYMSKVLSDKRHAAAMKAILLSPHEDAFRGALNKTAKGKELTHMIWRG
jgi:hypothetical protein